MKVLKVNVYVVCMLGDRNENVLDVFVCCNKEDLSVILEDSYGEFFDIKDEDENGFMGFECDDENGGVIVNVNKFIENVDENELKFGLGVMLNNSKNGFVSVCKGCINEDVLEDVSFERLIEDLEVSNEESKGIYFDLEEVKKIKIKVSSEWNCFEVIKK